MENYPTRMGEYNHLYCFVLLSNITKLFLRNLIIQRVWFAFLYVYICVEFMTRKLLGRT